MNTSWRKNYLRYKTYLLNTVRQYRRREGVKVYLEILLSLATITIFAILALRPTLLTIAQLLKDIENKKVIVSQMDEKIKNINAAQLLMDQERQRVEKLKTAMPQSADPEVFIRQLEGVVGKNQVAVNNMSLGKAVVLGNVSGDINANLPEGTEALNFSINSTSSAEVLQSLLLDVENLRRPVLITSVNFSQDADPLTDEKIVTISINGSSPFYRKKVDGSQKNI